MKNQDRPYFKDEFNVVYEMGKIRIVDSSKDRIRYQPVNITKIVYMMLCCMDGEHSNEEILKLLEKRIDIPRDNLKRAYEKVLIMLEDYLDYNTNKTRLILDNNIIKQTENLLDNKLEKNILQQIIFSIESRCGFECKYCFEDAGPWKPKKKTISTEKWKEIMQNAKKIGAKYVLFSGGDPVLKKDLCKYIKISKELDYIVRMSTKSYVNKEKMKQYKDAGLDLLQVSLDSHESETVDFLAGKKGTYDGIIKTIKNAVDCGIVVQARAVLTKYNVEHYEQWADLLVKLGVKNLTAGIVFASCGKDVQGLLPSKEQINKLNATVHKVTKRYGNKVEIFYNQDYSLMINKPLEYITSHRHDCRGSRSVMPITSDGLVSYCDVLIDNPNMVVGDLNKQTVEEVWNSEELERLRYPKREDYTGTECYSCNWFEKCARKRCYMRSLAIYGKKFEKDPWCPKGEALPLYCPQ